MTTFRTLILSATLTLPAAVILTGVASWAQAADQPAAVARYLAVLADGTQVEGQAIDGWFKPDDAPRLGTTNLLDPGRPMAWLRDRTLPPWQPARDAAYVEFLDGDRLPGRVIAAGTMPSADEAADDCPANAGPYLLVVPAISTALPSQPAQAPLRVLASFVRRVVWGNRPRQNAEPGTLCYADGRRVAYRSLRWQSDAVTLLCDDGIRRVALADAAEIDLPAGNAWDAYYETLAVLSPDGAARLLRLETADGLLATTSPVRLRPTLRGSEADRANWYHMLQPAWSLDPLWIRFNTIRVWWSFAADEVPMSRLLPVRSVQRSILGGGWPWQADRNVLGDGLEAGDRPYGWGFGVHASNELWFELPDCVRGFRGRVGLDRQAGRGGCAQAMVYLNEPTGQPLYRSPLLIGSDQVADVGTQNLSGPSGGQKLLGLVTDAMPENRPPQTDPLDIRDTVDWLEPVLLLDGGKLRGHVEQAAARVIQAWNGWKIDAGQTAPLRTLWDEAREIPSRFALDVATENRPLTLSLQRNIADVDRWLLLHLWQATGKQAAAGRLEIRIDGRPIARADVPRHSVPPPPPLAIPLEGFRGANRKIEVAYTPGDANERLCWPQLALVPRSTRVDWTTLRPTSVETLSGATAAVQSDGSVLIGGEFKPDDAYTLTCETTLPRITAFRIEALPDASLPQNGPGRHASGTFVLSQFRVDVMTAQVETIDGRYVRIELPGGEKPTPLTLAEVQAFSAGQNVAIGGQATQSSTGHDAPAALAIDGNTDGNAIASKSLSYTGDDDRAPWWELDLGAVKPLDRIVIWNRTDNNFQTRLSNFRVTVLDAGRQTTFERTIAEPPLPSVVISRQTPAELTLASAAASFCQEKFSPEDCLENLRLDEPPNEGGWSIGTRTGQPHAAVFTPDKPLDGREKTLIFRLKQVYKGGHHTLGRFRLSVTAADPPVPAEPIAVEVPLLSP